MLQYVPGGGHGQCSASGVHAGHCRRHYSACGRSLQRCHLHCPLQHCHWLDTSGFQVVLQWNTVIFVVVCVCMCVCVFVVCMGVGVVSCVGVCVVYVHVFVCGVFYNLSS